MNNNYDTLTQINTPLIYVNERVNPMPRAGCSTFVTSGYSRCTSSDTMYAPWTCPSLRSTPHQRCPTTGVSRANHVNIHKITEGKFKDFSGVNSKNVISADVFNCLWAEEQRSRATGRPRPAEWVKRDSVMIARVQSKINLQQIHFKLKWLLSCNDVWNVSNWVLLGTFSTVPTRNNVDWLLLSYTKITIYILIEKD